LTTIVREGTPLKKENIAALKHSGRQEFTIGFHRRPGKELPRTEFHPISPFVKRPNGFSAHLRFF
jgi:hypothetical protein